MRRSWIVKLVVFGLVIGAAPAAWSGWRWYTNRPAYLLQRGHEAVTRGDDAAARHYARLLDERHKPMAARLVRGWMWLRHARQNASKQPTQPANALVPAIAGRVVAVLASQPLWVRMIGPTVSTLAPVPIRKRRPAVNRDYARALDEFSRIQDDGAMGDEATVRAAECLIELGARRFATEALTDLTERRPDVTDAHRWLAALYIDLNAPDQALPHLREWSRLDPKDGRPCRWIGFFIRDDKRYDEAVAAYREALQRRLDDRVKDEVRFELATTLAEDLHDYPQALAVLDEGNDSFRATADALGLRARCLADLDRNDEADAVLDQALQKHPHNGKLLTLRGETYLQTDRYRQAIAPLLEAAKLDPDNVRICQQLTQAYQLAHQPALAEKQRLRGEQARRRLERVGDLYTEARARPWDADVRYQLGLLCLQLHQLDKAATWLRAALACNPNHTGAQLALAEAEALRRPGRDRSRF